LRYTDNVQVLFASSFGRVAPGQLAGLGMTWTSAEATQIGAPGVRWEVALYDQNGRQIGRQVGIDHAESTLMAGERFTSWFTLEVPIDAPPGLLEIGLSRVDRTTRQPLTYVDMTGATGSEWRSPPIEVAS
jgi:hypothetical protein